MNFTRRDLGKIALAALPAGKLLAKPNSNFGGVWIGIILSPTALRGIPLPADEVLNNLVELGISGIEMQEVRAETWAGAPPAAGATYPGIPGGPVAASGRAQSQPAAPPPGGGTPTAAPGQGRSGARGGGMQLTPEMQEARLKAAEQIRQWRLSVSMDKYKALRKMYSDAGVTIYALRLAMRFNDMPDPELEYFFNMAQALGANQITVELPPPLSGSTSEDMTKRVGDYAAKRKMMVGYHNHAQVNFNSWDAALSQSKYNGINFDVGHFAAAVSQSPIPFIQKHYDRITCLHLKDRKFGTNGGQNMVWGQGDTPLREILQMMKKEKYGFPAGIELEYRIPEGSSTMTEIAKCLQFCKDALA